MKEIVIRIKIPVLLNQSSVPRPIMMLKDDDFGNATRRIEWKDRCYIEREKQIKPHASPALKT